MLIKITFSLFILFQCLATNAQENFYDYLKTGDYQVGYADTIIFDRKYQYEAYDYKGMKPCFIAIWHPITADKNARHYLHFNDFFTSKNKGLLVTTHKQLITSQKEIIIRDCIAENLKTGEANNFGDYSYKDILNSMGSIEIRSILHPIHSTTNFPVIIYHHGSQGNSFENFAMAEYFASRGFIFIAANFHLPFENTIFGLKPFDKIQQDEEEESLRTIVSFARSISKSSTIFFIGHSFGAQMGFRTLHHDSTISGMISLETTIEFKNDTTKIKEMWPEVYQNVVVNKSYYPFPVLLCAATGQAKPFDFFNKLNAEQLTFAPTKMEFEHNAYTSIFYLRYFLDPAIIQTDRIILYDRLNLYVKHLDVIHDFIDGIVNDEKKSGTATVFIE